MEIEQEMQRLANEARTASKPARRSAAFEDLFDDVLEEDTIAAAELLMETAARIILKDPDPGLRRDTLDEMQKLRSPGEDEPSLGYPAADYAAWLGEVSKRAAFDDSDEDVRAMAVWSLLEQADLARLAACDPSRKVRDKAMLCLKDQAVIGRVAREHPDREIRLALLSRLHDGAALRSVIDAEMDEAVRRQAEARFQATRPETDIPAGTVEIADEAFWGNDWLRHAEIPDGVRRIGRGAFLNCKNLTTLRLPEGLAEIGEEAFFGCTALTAVVLPQSLRIIGKAAFEFCESLTQISIPPRMKTVGEGAFQMCVALKTVTLSPGLVEIGKAAFENCRTLARIDVPGSVKRIGKRAFYNCYCMEEAVLHEGLQRIEEMAFWNNNALTFVRIPKSVRSVDGAFDFCDRLESAAFSAALPCIRCGGRIARSTGVCPECGLKRIAD